MNNIFKKLFDIPYNEKIFTIFVDTKHRYTFLEKDSKGDYIYPTMEDYKALNQIYNVHDWNHLPTTKTYTRVPCTEQMPTAPNSGYSYASTMPQDRINITDSDLSRYASWHATTSGSTTPHR